MPFDMLDGPHQQVQFLTGLAEFDRGDCRVHRLPLFERRKYPLHPPRSIMAILAHKPCQVPYLLNEVGFPIHENILNTVRDLATGKWLIFIRMFNRGHC